ncbi:hypothetical protein [Streptomyces sp. NPDC048338]|uniref:hypothetical protein n=1 Tax=Streptomyces sp. NPDC048338 TaxID=3365536 RepID=UPI0037145010
MDEGEHGSGDGQVRGDERTARSAALRELHERLEDGRARSRLTLDQLVVRAERGRTTVWKAFREVPSAETVAALARVLRLPADELLALRRAAAGEDVREEPGPGMPIGDCDPHALEVHPAGPDRERCALPGYVRRAHDAALDRVVQDAIGGHSRMAVLVGTSSTGKTRACWEAVQPLAAHGWRLWHPFDPTRAAAALDAVHRLRPRTVVWLNEAQHYLGDTRLGEEIAASIHTVLTDPERAPVLVLATLWPVYERAYRAAPTPGGPDPHTRARELLAGRTVTVPPRFDAQALSDAHALAEAGDRLLSDALVRVSDTGELTQDLAGAPELLDAFEHGTPAARALLEAAMDARRLGVGLHLPRAFLTEAALDYLADSDDDLLAEGWDDAAYAELGRHVHGRQAPLRRVPVRPRLRPPGAAVDPGAGSSPPAGSVYRLADYLEQHGRSVRRPLCPPASFWHATHAHLSHPDELDRLAQAAGARHRLQWAHHLSRSAAERGSASALVRLAQACAEAGDHTAAEALARRAAGGGRAEALVELATIRARDGDAGGAEALLGAAVRSGSAMARVDLMLRREAAGDEEGAEAEARRAAEAGNVRPLLLLARVRAKTGGRESAEPLFLEAAALGDRSNAPAYLARVRFRAGDQEGAEAVIRESAEAGDPHAMCTLGELRERAGDRKGAEELLQRAAAAGDLTAVGHLALIRERAGDREGAEELAFRAGRHALLRLTETREEAGDRTGAEAVAHRAARAGHTYVYVLLAGMREKAGDHQGADALAREAVLAGHTRDLVALFDTWHRSPERVEGALHEAAAAGDYGALSHLALMRARAGDREEAATLARRAVDTGDGAVGDFWGKIRRDLWPHGLDPEGTPTAPWSATSA